jgi:hypothetical protein
MMPVQFNHWGQIMADLHADPSKNSSGAMDLSKEEFSAAPVQFKDKEWHDIHQAWQSYSGRFERATWPHTSQVGGSTVDVIVFRDDEHPAIADWQVQPFGSDPENRYVAAPALESLIGKSVSFRACFGNYCLLLVDMGSIKTND